MHIFFDRLPVMIASLDDYCQKIRSDIVGSEKRRMTLTLSEDTFQYLEVLAVGLLLERNPNADREMLLQDKVNKADDFVPAVASLLEEIANSFAEGTRRPDSWEREVVEKATGWDGTINRGMFGDKVEMAELVDIDKS